MQFLIELFISTSHPEFHWRHFGQESCIVLFQIINLGKVYRSQIYRVYLLFMMNAYFVKCGEKSILS